MRRNDETLNHWLNLYNTKLHEGYVTILGSMKIHGFEVEEILPGYNFTLDQGHINKGKENVGNIVMERSPVK